MYCGPLDASFAITPGSLRVYYPLDDAECRRPRLTMSNIFDDNVLLYMELHARSEHWLEGKQYDAELQMVHVSEADRGVYRDQLTTVSLMLQADADKDDVEFQWMLNQWQAVADSEAQACASSQRLLRRRMGETLPKMATRNANMNADTDADAIINNDSNMNEDRKAREVMETARQQSTKQRDLQFTASPCRSDENGRGCEPLGPRRRMFPYSLWTSIWYYFYYGSMTSPPCSDNVTYYIMDKPRRISRRQYRQLTHLLKQSRNDDCEQDTIVSPTGDNFRPVRDVNSQIQSMMKCSPSDFGHFMYPQDEQ